MSLKINPPAVLAVAVLLVVAWRMGKDKGAARGGATHTNRAYGPRLPALDVETRVRQLVSGAAPNMPAMPQMPQMPRMPNGPVMW
jgi:hypothetical protein